MLSKWASNSTLQNEVFQAASVPCLELQALDQEFKNTAFKDAFSLLLQDAPSVSHSERN